MNKRVKYILASIVIALGLGSGVIYFNKNYIYTNTVAKNLSVEGVDISLLTKQDAIKKISNTKSPEELVLTYNGEEYIISPKAIDLKYNLEETVNKAFGYTKTDDYIENLKRYFKLNKSKVNYDMKVSYDEVKLSKELEEISKNINIKVEDASIYISNTGNISRKASVNGVEVDLVSIKEKMYDSIINKKHEKIEITTITNAPRVKTEDVENVNSLLGEYTTKFSTNDSNRTTNIYLSSKNTSDVLLMPGEEFSYNTLTGKRIKSNGYKDAPVIVNGKLEQDVGGGVCQVSSTMFNAVMYSGLDITSRRNHSLKSSYVPIGQDAMVSDGGSDFRFKNAYSHPVYIKNIYGNGNVTTKIYGNVKDKKNISIRVEEFMENGLEASKTYLDYKNNEGKIISSKYISKSVYKKPKE